MRTFSEEVASWSPPPPRPRPPPGPPPPPPSPLARHPRAVQMGKNKRGREKRTMEDEVTSSTASATHLLKGTRSTNTQDTS